MLRRLSVDPVLAVMIYRGPSDQLDEAAQRMLASVENRLHIPLGGLSPDEVAALAAALRAGPLDDQAIQRLYQGTGGHPLYLRTVLSEGSGSDPRAPGRLALPRSLAAAIGDHLRVLPAETRAILEMLSVLNLRLPLAQLGQAAEVDSPSAAIEPAVASGLVDWWPDEPSLPGRDPPPAGPGRHLRRHHGHQAPRAARPRRLRGQRVGVVGAPGGRPGPAGRGPGRPAGAAGRRGGGRRPPGAGRHPPAVGLGHLPGPGRPGTAAADRGAAPDAGRGVPGPGPAPGGGGGGAVPAAQLRAGHDGVLLRPARRGGTAVQPGAGAGTERPGQPAAGRDDRQPAGGYLHAARGRGEGDDLRPVGAGHRLPGRGGRQPDPHPDRHRRLPGGRAARRPWPNWGTWMPIRPGSARSTSTACRSGGCSGCWPATWTGPSPT